MKNERTDKNEKIKELTEKLHEGIKNLFESDRYKDYLQTMAKFHNYSFNNTILIWSQRPDATAVAGYRAWQTKFERYVKPGSKGIMIYEPAYFKRTLKEKVLDQDGNPMKDQDGNFITRNVEHTFPTFKIGYVYAFEDTNGKPLPSIVSIVDKEVSNYNAIMDALRKISPAPIRFDNITNGANGYYDLLKREIVIKENLPDAQKLKTTIHEVAHSLLHDKVDGLDLEATKREMEVSAESVAFVVSSWLGVSTSEYSFGYVAGWSATQELIELQRKMEVIRSTANKIITSLDEELRPQLPIVIEEEIEEEKEMLQTVTVVKVQQEKPPHTVSHRRR